MDQTRTCSLPCASNDSGTLINLLLWLLLNNVSSIPQKKRKQSRALVKRSGSNAPSTPWIQNSTNGLTRYRVAVIHFHLLRFLGLIHVGLVRWDAKCEDDMLLMQSASLHASYYQVQMIIHRPFVTKYASPLEGREMNVLFQPFALCAHAARACSHILKAHLEKLPGVPSTLLVGRLSGAVVFPF